MDRQIFPSIYSIKTVSDQLRTVECHLPSPWWRQRTKEQFLCISNISIYSLSNITVTPFHTHPKCSPHIRNWGGEGEGFHKWKSREKWNKWKSQRISDFSSFSEYALTDCSRTWALILNLFLWAFKSMQNHQTTMFFVFIFGGFLFVCFNRDQEHYTRKRREGRGREKEEKLKTNKRL